MKFLNALQVLSSCAIELLMFSLLGTVLPTFLQFIIGYPLTFQLYSTTLLWSIGSTFCLFVTFILFCVYKEKKHLTSNMLFSIIPVLKINRGNRNGKV